MLGDFLKGLEARQPQTVGNMTCIPLVCQNTAYEKVGTVRDVYLERDTAYDKLTLGTSSAHPAIAPSGFTLITKEKAQDRTVASKEIIPAKKPRTVNAFCVQSSQPGHMSKVNNSMQEFRMLPATIRMVAFNNRNGNGNYSALWQSLGTYNQSSGVTGDFLKSFFEEYKDRLSQFIAEFELVPYQRGAIILINDELVGVELSPNPLAFSEQWEPLIRDCYGSEAIVRQKNQAVINEPAMFTNVNTFDELLAKLDEVEEKEFAFVEKQINMVFTQNETQSARQVEDGLSVVDLDTPDFVGQAVRNGENIIDLTLLRRDAASRGFRVARRQ